MCPLDNGRLSWRKSLSQQLFTSISITVGEPLPALKRQFQLQTARPELWKGVGLHANPIVNLSGVLGNNIALLGADVSFDPKQETSPSAMLDLAFLVKAWLVHSPWIKKVTPWMHPTISQLVLKWLANFQTRRTPWGCTHALVSLTTVKARIKNCGKTKCSDSAWVAPKVPFDLIWEIWSQGVDKAPKSKVWVSIGSQTLRVEMLYAGGLTGKWGVVHRKMRSRTQLIFDICFPKVATRLRFWFSNLWCNNFYWFGCILIYLVPSRLVGFD